MAHRKFVNGTTGVQLHPERLDKPLHWRKPRRIFVCSLADLFHEDVPDEFLLDVFETISEADKGHDHVFQVLTKRPERMRDFFTALPQGEHGTIGFTSRLTIRAAKLGLARALPNLWLGVTIENARYTYRADILREIPAAVRFISAEPLLGSLFESEQRREVYAEDNPRDRLEKSIEVSNIGRKPLDLTGIDWVIAGAESGLKRRPMELDWVRELRDACFHWGGTPDTAFFFKQQIVNGRKVECPELDGRQWMEFPR
jgi:protein gp37